MVEINKDLSKEDFGVGFSDEIINVNALQEGRQIISCKTYLGNKYIFLLHKIAASKYIPSEEGRKYENPPAKHGITNLIAETQFLSIPGRNEEFWKELYMANEFDLWKITEPLRFFANAQNMYLWILRVYKMPFIEKGKHFIHSAWARYNMKDPEILKSIQSGFNNKTFKPVLTYDKFNKRKDKIEDIARRYREIQ
jgi:hypothetical protein